MSLYGTSILFKASTMDILNRIQRSRTKRMRFFSHMSHKEEIEFLLKKRSYYYHLLKDYVYNTSLYDIDFIVKDFEKRFF